MTVNKCFFKSILSNNSCCNCDFKSAIINNKLSLFSLMTVNNCFFKSILSNNSCCDFKLYNIIQYITNNKTEIANITIVIISNN